jgi:anti-anti-sigma factor
MEIDEEHTADLTIVDVKGPVGSNGAGQLADKLKSLIDAGRTQLVVNLEKVDYISSAGFRVLLVASRLVEKAKGKLVLCSLSPHLQSLFELAEFTDQFEICPSRPKVSAS